MIGDEPNWLVNLIITIAALPIIVGSLVEHAGTETLLGTLLLLFVTVTVYTALSGKFIDPPRPETSRDGPVPTRSNPFAVHAETEPEPAEDGEEDGTPTVAEPEDDAPTVPEPEDDAPTVAEPEDGTPTVAEPED